MHVVLRGGSNGPNYGPEHIASTEAALAEVGAHPSIMVDCSHANSNKDHTQQSRVVEEICAMKAQGNRSITGVMIESNIHEGRQNIAAPAELDYGVSITDACVDWEETQHMLNRLADAVRSTLLVTRASA